MLERLVDKLIHVQYFSVSSICSLPEEVRTQLVQFAAVVIEQQKSLMISMDFSATV